MMDMKRFLVMTVMNVPMVPITVADLQSVLTKSAVSDARKDFVVCYCQKRLFEK